MSSFSDQNNPYRRPRPHFSAGQPHARPPLHQRHLLTGSALLMALALLMILAMIPLATEESPQQDAAQTNLDSAQALQADCAVIQQMTYTPCGHQVTRRTALPTELAGKGRADLTAAYDAWQITSFSPTEVSMTKTFEIYCPQHIVLLPDGSGMLCAWQNKYSDGLALVKELGVAVSELPDAAQSQARRGKGFDSLEALEQWLESAES